MSLRIGPGGLNFRVRDTLVSSGEFRPHGIPHTNTFAMGRICPVDIFAEGATPDNTYRLRIRTGGTNPKFDARCSRFEVRKILILSVAFYKVKRQRDY